MPRHVNWILPAVIAASLLSLGGHRFYRMALSTPVPHQAKLVDCTGPVLNCSFIAPKGYGFSMVMAGPQQAALDFSGLVRLSSTSDQPLEFEIVSDRTRSCTWLQSQGIPSASIMTDALHPRYPGLEFSAGRKYQVAVSFTRSPPPGCSVWMTWLEHAGE